MRGYLRALLVLGLLTRLAAIPTVANISVTIVATKIPLLLGRGYWIFNLPKADSYGFWGMMHGAHTDFAMLLGGMFLLIVGEGNFSFDALLASSYRHLAQKQTVSRPRAWAGLDLWT